MGNIKEEPFFQAFCELSDWIWFEVHKFDGLKGALADQITRSIDSVGANLVEGYARGSNESVKAVLQFFRYSLGSAYESLYWMDRMLNRGLVKKTVGLAMYRELDAACKELQRFITGLEVEQAKKGKIK